MDVMIEASLNVERFMQFCDILEKTSDYEAFVNSMRTQLAIRLSNKDIEEKVKLKLLVPLLEEKGVLASNEAKELLENAPDGSSQETLISYLKDADEWLIFLECLKKVGQFSIVKTIEEKLHLNNNQKNKQKKKVSLQFTSRDSGIFSPSPMTSIQATDLEDGLSRLAIIKEETSCNTDLDVIQLINDEINELDMQHKIELQRLERYYEQMQLILESKKNEAQTLLDQLHHEQKQYLKKQIRRGQRDQIMAGKINWFLPQVKPDAYLKMTTDVAAVDQIKEWGIPVIVGSAHYSTTKAQGLGLKWACTNKTASFAVEFRDIQSHLLITKSMDDMVELTTNFDCMIIDSKNSVVSTEQFFIPSLSEWVEGIKTITYVPTITGYLDILLKCGGRPINGSPFRVLVYPVSEYYKLMTCPQEILCIRETITGLTTTCTGDVAICTENGKLYIVKHLDGGYRFDDVAAYHGLSLNYPRGLSCDNSNNLVVANTKKSQLVKASTPEVREKLLISSTLKFEPMCVAAHDRVVAASGIKDVVVCDHNLDILHTVSFSSLISAITISDNLSVHVAVFETFGCKCYNYACIENIDSKAYKTRFAHLSLPKTTCNENRINDLVTDKDRNIIVCYTAQPSVAIFTSTGELLSSYKNWGSDWYTEFAAVAVSQHSGLLLVDQTRNKLLESHLDQNLAIYTPSSY